MSQDNEIGVKYTETELYLLAIVDLDTLNELETGVLIKVANQLGGIRMTQNKQTHPYRQFKPGNSIKVKISNGQEFKGIYLGDTLYSSVLKNDPSRGQFLLFQESGRERVIDLLTYFNKQNLTVVNVSPARLIRHESDFLRKIYKDNEQIQKRQESPERLSDEEIQKILTGVTGKKEQLIQYYKQDNKYHVGGLFYGRAYADELNIDFESEDALVMEGDVPQPAQEDIEEFLVSNGYPYARIDTYRQLANKYRDIAVFYRPCFLVDEHADNNYDDMDEEIYYAVYLAIDFEIKNNYQLTRERLNEMVRDIVVFKTRVMTRE